MINSEITPALRELRAHAESLMVDAVLIEHPTGEMTQDPVTLEDVPAYAAIYAGKARIQRTGALSSQDDVSGDYEFGVDAVIVQAPLAATGVVRGDRVTVTALGPLSDPDLLGLVATVRANLTKTHPTKRTLMCEEVSDV